jgi:hypothetical protein
MANCSPAYVRNQSAALKKDTNTQSPPPHDLGRIFKMSKWSHPGAFRNCEWLSKEQRESVISEKTGRNRPKKCDSWFPLLGRAGNQRRRAIVVRRRCLIIARFEFMLPRERTHKHIWGTRLAVIFPSLISNCSASYFLGLDSEINTYSHTHREKITERRVI